MCRYSLFIFHIYNSSLYVWALSVFILLKGYDKELCFSFFSSGGALSKLKKGLWKGI